MLIMRLWTLHPRYLDAKGLVACWREALLAQKVLQGGTTGYQHHPQLHRFRNVSDPLAAIALYLTGIHEEAGKRGYTFDAGKIGRIKPLDLIAETRGQLLYEWSHLVRKLKLRDPSRHQASLTIKRPKPHPMFRIIAGDVQKWERTIL